MVYTDPNQLSKADSLERYYLSEEADDQEQACESKLAVKLKLPKFDGETKRANSRAAMEDVDDEKNNFNFYCYECKRGFSSGKAFGGHKSSAHVQAGKDYYRSKKQVRPRDSSDDVEDSNDHGVLKKMVNKCKICKKVFQNRKCLYGHMRLHPERSYRGMNPPPSPSSSSSSQPKKRKTCDPDQSPNSSSSSVDKLSASSFPSDLDVVTASKIPKSGKRIRSFSSQDDHDVNPTMETDSDDQSDNFKISIGNNVYERKLEEDIQKGVEDLKKKYKCKICYKSFESYRALGGHMSAHNKISNRNSTSSSTRFTLPNNTSSNPNPCFSSSPENDQSIISQTAITSINSTTSASHRCYICTKIFSSGQALGGHMRCHYSPKTESFTSSSDHQNIDNNISTNTSGSQQKMLDIDLNELPKDDDE